MANILIAFYSRLGATEALAKAIAEGAHAAGGEVRLRRAREIAGPEQMASVSGWTENAARMNALYPAPTREDATWADGIIIGSPTRFGAMAVELKIWIDDVLGSLWAKGAWVEGGLNGRAGAVFGATATAHGGNESSLLSMITPLMHLGLIIVPTGFADAAMFVAGTPYGASAVTGAEPLPTAPDLAAARFQGRRVAEVAAALRAARLVVRG